jgi:hypothetical protein
MKQEIIVSLVAIALFSALFGYIVGQDDRMIAESVQPYEYKRST